MIKRLLMKKIPHIPQTSVSRKTPDFKGMNQRGGKNISTSEATQRERTYSRTERAKQSHLQYSDCH
jgi:hypothetical protein